ncbi:MAG: exo-alpha-sialidase [Lachnospiraceae bacterium]|nr:exo-alpha-sialidase [Lachnospiraceae bacterium]
MDKKTLGSITAEFPPSRENHNPRNSEGAFLALPDGSIFFVYSRFKGERLEDWAPSDICLTISTDGGRSFGGERILFTCEEENAVNIMSLSLLKMNNGEIGLFYLLRSAYTRMQMYLRRSSDLGLTWDERVLCTPQEGFFVVNNDRVVRLSNGRILIPAASHKVLSPCTKESLIRQETDSILDSRSEVIFFYSDDDGRSWKASEGKCCMPHMANCRSGLQEPGILELSPNVLWAFSRTDLGRQYEMYSFDNGETWTTAQPSRFTSPNSPLSMKRNKNGWIYAVWNPIPEYNGRDKTAIFTGGRTPYMLAVSKDNGKTFSEGLIFEDDKNSGYCYCSILFTEEAVLLGYNAGGPEDGSCLAKARIRRIPYRELEGTC